MKIKLNQKPIDIDAHLKYRCPKCSVDHWISLKEAKTKNFKIVCDCGLVFQPKQINKIKIRYSSQEKTKITPSSKMDDKHCIPEEIINQCSKVLVSYGFTQQEAQSMLEQEYIKNPTTDCKQLLKFTLESLGVNNNEQYTTNIV